MPRRGRSTTVGKIAKFYQDRRVSEIRVLGEVLRREQHTAIDETREAPGPSGTPEMPEARDSRKAFVPC